MQRKLLMLIHDNHDRINVWNLWKAMYARWKTSVDTHGFVLEIQDLIRKKRRVDRLIITMLVVLKYLAALSFLVRILRSDFMVARAISTYK